MRVFVTGGTGALGSYAVPALIDAGHEVTAMARTAAKADVLRRQGAAPVQVSLFDRDGLAEAFGGHAAVVNLASSLPSPQRFMLKSAWKDCHRIRIQGSASVVDAALAAGVPRLVQESVAMIYRDGGSSGSARTGRSIITPSLRATTAPRPAPGVSVKMAARQWF